ncbi:uncharacterized protein LOC112350095 [Selaginella moellendorffii]|uniref:uncharacterized protein LOC112350095 n=1 Tax=Selaginella moellendorffii TaxID=88036 RepID=UPI000D1CE355|nr:uncharacterized protein LOC112350095 [Selaginella moellendorffii]|eukprot:XP_024541505.1 uncharacterized protein LOC112350095 [Selaginella moellendorffii]
MASCWSSSRQDGGTIFIFRPEKNPGSLDKRGSGVEHSSSPLGAQETLRHRRTLTLQTRSFPCMPSVGAWLMLERFSKPILARASSRGTLSYLGTPRMAMPSKLSISSRKWKARAWRDPVAQTE